MIGSRACCRQQSRDWQQLLARWVPSLLSRYPIGLLLRCQIHPSRGAFPRAMPTILSRNITTVLDPLKGTTGLLSMVLVVSAGNSTIAYLSSAQLLTLAWRARSAICMVNLTNRIHASVAHGCLHKERPEIQVIWTVVVDKAKGRILSPLRNPRSAHVS